MKIVRFKDGNYGVRRWSWGYLGYQFLDSTARKDDHYWFTFVFPYNGRMTLEAARAVYKSMNQPAQKEDNDYGKPIPEELY